jgi:DNA-binding MarR family transcriptional regulator
VETDRVDRIVEQWAVERPDLDLSTKGLLLRISRIEFHLNRWIERTVAAFGLTRGEYDLLATLRREGPPYRLTPKELTDSLMLTSGGMTNRIDRLEEAGLVVRQPDPRDRRGVLVALTPAGRERLDAALPAVLAIQDQLLAGLTPEEQETLVPLLRKWLLSLAAMPAPAMPSTRST